MLSRQGILVLSLAFVFCFLTVWADQVDTRSLRNLKPERASVDVDENAPLQITAGDSYKKSLAIRANPGAGESITIVVPGNIDPDVFFRTIIKRYPDAEKTEIVLIPMVSAEYNRHIAPVPVLYCSQCGMIPSPEGMKCPVTNNSHSFKKQDADKLLYCSHCGEIPSPKGSKCFLTNASHSFTEAEANKLMVCSLCGASPSPKGTKCPVTNTSHNFKEY